MSRAVIGLGANLGDIIGALVGAVELLEQTPGVGVVAVSSLWTTAPIGGPEQPEYLNAVVIVDSILEPLSLLGLCRSAEEAAGRERNERWGPRTLDMDIIDIDGFTSSDPQLLVPHPRAHERAFVLAPWAELTPQWPLAAAGQVRTVVDWLAGVEDQEVRLHDPGWWNSRP